MAAQLDLGEDVLPRCATDPIHLIGSIQPHGALFAIDTETSLCCIASNTENFTGIPAEEMLGTSLFDHFSPSSRHALLAIMDAAQKNHSVMLPTIVETIHEHQRVDVTCYPSDDLLIFEIEHAAEMSIDMLTYVEHAARRLETYTDVQGLLSELVHSVRELVGFDRVMVYQFHNDEHGEVVAEVRNENQIAYLGHHFPATDIPLQARRLYRNLVCRSIVDRDAMARPLVATPDRAGTQLDLSRSTIRAVPSIHLKYMKNMNDRASSSFPMYIDGRLEFLLSCTSTQPKWIPHPVRLACVQIARFAASDLLLIRTRNAIAQRATATKQRRALCDRAERMNELAAAFVPVDALALDFLSANGLAYTFGDSSGLVGNTIDQAHIDELVSTVRTDPGFSNVWTTNHLSEVLPQHFAEVDGGVLVLLFDWGEDYVIWFRDAITTTTKWLGDPNSNDITGLSPRTSFSTWAKKSDGRCQDWTPANLESVEQFRLELAASRTRIAEARAANLATIDPLTGLLNRRAFAQTDTNDIEIEQDLAKPLGVIFIDLNRFKEVNDTYGHAAGDKVLTEVAHRIGSVTRAADISGRIPPDLLAGRLGGDEFVVVIPRATEAALAAITARIESQFLTPIQLGEVALPVTAAIGGALGDPTQNLNEVMALADEQMYQKKLQAR